MTAPRIRLGDFLPKLPLFRQMEAEQIARLAAGCSELHLARNTVLYHRGDPCNGLHVMVCGQIKLSLQTGRGDEMVLELVGPGMSFGEGPLFSGQPHLAAAEALLDSTVLHIAKDVLLAETEHDPQFARRLIGAIGERLYRRLAEFEEYVLASGTERVISYLLRGDQCNGERDAESVALPASKHIIASRLNLTHEHFSRILRELMSAGLIEVEGREVRILNRKRLYGYVA